MTTELQIDKKKKKIRETAKFNTHTQNKAIFTCFPQKGFPGSKLTEK